MLFILPALTVAWLEPTQLADDGSRPRAGGRARLAFALLALTFAIPFCPVLNGRTAFAIPTTRVANSSGDAVQVPDASGSGPLVAHHAVLDCGPAQDDFAVISTTCVAEVDTQGTLRYTMTALASPLPLTVAQRTITWRVVVTRDGTVLQRPA